MMRKNTTIFVRIAIVVLLALAPMAMGGCVDALAATAENMNRDNKAYYGE